MYKNHHSEEGLPNDESLVFLRGTEKLISNFDLGPSLFACIHFIKASLGHLIRGSQSGNNLRVLIMATL